MNRCFVVVVIALSWLSMLNAADRVVRIWPNEPPPWDAPVEPEFDQTQPGDREQAGGRVTRLTNVSTPELHVYPATDSAGNPSQTAVIICPGGGFNILAWDLEGTEIATQFRNGGVTAMVLKYRVPTRKRDDPWTPVIQDIQRSMALVRSGEITQSEIKTVGLLGFSAGGNAVARTATSTGPTYSPIDQVDQSHLPPDFACLVYPAWLSDEDDPFRLREGIDVTEKTCPMFFAHAEDDPHFVMNSVTMFTHLHQAGVPSA
ncbi:MAG: alpha/beta hydrolase, partial [Planctomycetota bacterium]